MNINKTIYGIIKSEDLDNQVSQNLQNIMLGELKDDNDVILEHPTRTYRELIEYMNPNTLEYVKKLDGVEYNIIPFYDRENEDVFSSHIILLEHLDDWDWDVEEELTNETK